MIAGQDITPKNDATLGLIFRLNALWAGVDSHAKSGEYDAWDNTLEALYRNLLYRDEVVIVKNTQGKIIKIGLTKNDEEQYRFLCKRISRSKLNYLCARGVNENKISNRRIARSKWYKAVSLKDIWLRKLMNGLNLYIKETVSDPGSVMGW